MPEAHQQANTKGIGIYWLRMVINSFGRDADQNMSNNLSAEDYQLYRNLMPMSWVAEDTAVRIYEAAGNIIYADATNVLYQVGYGMASANLSTTYKVLIRFATISYVLTQASRLWRTYHDTGEAKAYSGEQKNSVIFSVIDFPGLPIKMRQVLREYVAGLSKICGVKNGYVTLDESNPQFWKWILTW
ncbi:MAG: hypothetical protein JW841_17655 [Deltaproteobacteria bacterium]|nr:hypothetical protein [Deltaproteobacteria bacterium]